MVRILYLLYAITAYAVFFATFLYLVAFLANMPGLPVTVDAGRSGASLIAGTVDLALIAVFGLQHSIMARQGFKAAWTRIIPAPIERSTYVVFASLALILMFVFWRPIPGTVWNVINPVGAALLWGAFGLGWAILLLSTFLLNHFELFGLSQVWRNLRGAANSAPQFRQPLFYRLVRHPLYTGFIIAFWATPVMTPGHFLFAAGMTVYIVIAIQYEERDLIDLFGTDYEAYRDRVGMLMPKPGRG